MGGREKANGLINLLIILYRWRFSSSLNWIIFSASTADCGRAFRGFMKFVSRWWNFEAWHGSLARLPWYRRT